MNRLNLVIFAFCIFLYFSPLLAQEEDELDSLLFLNEEELEFEDFEEEDDTVDLNEFEDDIIADNPLITPEDEPLELPANDISAETPSSIQAPDRTIPTSPPSLESLIKAPPSEALPAAMVPKTPPTPPAIVPTEPSTDPLGVTSTPTPPTPAPPLAPFAPAPPTPPPTPAPAPIKDKEIESILLDLAKEEEVKKAPPPKPIIPEPIPTEPRYEWWREKNEFNTQELPDVIYKKEYAPRNTHLPKSFSIDDLDRWLFKVAASGDINGVRALLNTGMEPDPRDRYGNTPLITAIIHGNIDTARILLARNANPNVQNNLGLSPLHVAAYKGRDDIAKLLLHMGADPNVKNNHGITPLEFAATGKHFSTAKVLLDNGAVRTSRFFSGMVQNKSMLNAVKHGKGDTTQTDTIDDDIDTKTDDIDSFIPSPKPEPRQPAALPTEEQIQQQADEPPIPETDSQEVPTPTDEAVSQEEIQPDEEDTGVWKQTKGGLWIKVGGRMPPQGVGGIFWFNMDGIWYPLDPFDPKQKEKIDLLKTIYGPDGSKVKSNVRDIPYLAPKPSEEPIQPEPDIPSPAPAAIKPSETQESPTPPSADPSTPAESSAPKEVAPQRTTPEPAKAPPHTPPSTVEPAPVAIPKSFEPEDNVDQNVEGFPWFEENLPWKQNNTTTSEDEPPQGKNGIYWEPMGDNIWRKLDPNHPSDLEKIKAIKEGLKPADKPIIPTEPIKKEQEPTAIPSKPTAIKPKDTIEIPIPESMKDKPGIKPVPPLILSPSKTEPTAPEIPTPPVTIKEELQLEPSEAPIIPKVPEQPAATPISPEIVPTAPIEIPSSIDSIPPKAEEIPVEEKPATTDTIAPTIPAIPAIDKTLPTLPSLPSPTEKMPDNLEGLELPKLEELEEKPDIKAVKPEPTTPATEPSKEPSADTPVINEKLLKMQRILEKAKEQKAKQDAVKPEVEDEKKPVDKKLEMQKKFEEMKKMFEKIEKENKQVAPNISPKQEEQKPLDDDLEIIPLEPEDVSSQEGTTQEDDPFEGFDELPPLPELE